MEYHSLDSGFDDFDDDHDELLEALLSEQHDGDDLEESFDMNDLDTPTFMRKKSAKENEDAGQ